MIFRSWTLAVLTLLSVTSPALASPATVQLRVEGATSTLFEGPVTTDGHAVSGDDTGPHPCDGTNNGAYPTPGPTMTAALDDAAIPGGWQGAWDGDFQDFLIDRIGPDSGTSFTSYWGTALNFQPTLRGGCQERVAAGDEALFALGDVYSQHLLKLTGPGTATAGIPFTVQVLDGKDESPMAGADVRSGGTVLGTTGADGSATVSLASTGNQVLKAERSDAIRSNGLALCVSSVGGAECGTGPPPGATGGAGTPRARDTRAPVVRVSSLRNGAVLHRGPRLLRGTATDDVSGVREVRLSLRSHPKGKGCRWWSARRERFAGHDCGRRFFSVGAEQRWSYLLPARLRPGHYVLDVETTDRAGNRARSRRGAGRIAFDVIGKSRRAVTGSARGPRVQVMVVGRGGTLAGPRYLRARAVQVRGSGRLCRVGASTPLAPLVTALRRRGVEFHVRDYGRCSRERADASGQLFVDRIGRDRNRGRNGWFFKVNDVAPEVGGGDPTASFGGRRHGLAAGARVLWFYCLYDAGAESCQRSLSVDPSSDHSSVGGTLRVRVVGRDNRGRGAPVAGADVRLGATHATTGADGVAIVAVRRAGRFRLTASKAGTLPAFPVTVTVNAATIVPGYIR